MHHYTMTVEDKGFHNSSRDCLENNIATDPDLKCVVLCSDASGYDCRNKGDIFKTIPLQADPHDTRYQKYYTRNKPQHPTATLSKGMTNEELVSYLNEANMEAVANIFAQERITGELLAQWKRLEKLLTDKQAPFGNIWTLENRLKEAGIISDI